VKKPPTRLCERSEAIQAVLKELDCLVGRFFEKRRFGQRLRTCTLAFPQ